MSRKVEKTAHISRGEFFTQPLQPLSEPGVRGLARGDSATVGAAAISRSDSFGRVSITDRGERLERAHESDAIGVLAQAGKLRVTSRASDPVAIFLCLLLV